MEREWLFDSKLGNAADAMQGYLDSGDKGRAAAQVGRLDSAVDQAVQNTASADDLVPEPDTAYLLSQIRLAFLKSITLWQGSLAFLKSLILWQRSLSGIAKTVLGLSGMAVHVLNSVSVCASVACAHT